MIPEQFTSFETAQPAANKFIIVSNNVGSKDALGEMSHVWMTNSVQKSDSDGFTATDEAGRQIICLSHWKDALVTPEEFTSFEAAKPLPNKHIIVTNDIDAKDEHGEMSSVWLKSFYHESSNPEDGLIIFDAADCKITGLTHWKYA